MLPLPLLFQPKSSSFGSSLSISMTDAPLPIAILLYPSTLFSLGSDGSTGSGSALKSGFFIIMAALYRRHPGMPGKFIRVPILPVHVRRLPPQPQPVMKGLVFFHHRPPFTILRLNSERFISFYQNYDTIIILSSQLLAVFAQSAIFFIKS